MKTHCIIISILCLVVSFQGFSQNDLPVISFDSETHDFGNIREDSGLVSCLFTFTNKGASPLVITEIKSGCGCTAPEFTSEPVAPGYTGNIKVTFDPKNRPGTFRKAIQVYTNATAEMVELLITGSVIIPAYIASEYKYIIGDLRIRSIHIPYGRMTKGEVMDKRIELVSVADKPMNVQLKDIPDYIQISDTEFEIQPYGMMDLTMQYNSSIVEDWDFVIDRISVLIDGEAIPNNQLTVSAIIGEDFTHLNEEQLMTAPVARFAPETISFEPLKQGRVSEHRYILTNDGQTDLIIRKIKPSCGCTVIQPSQSVVKPGQSIPIKAVFNSSGRSGDQKFAITIITNDPKNSRALLWLEGEVTN